MLGFVLALISGYVLGSIPSSVWVGKAWYGLDVRDYGSGNAGATNTFRVLGFKAGSVVMAMDVTKGILASGLGGYWATFGTFSFGSFDPVSVLALIGGLAAIVGHMFPLFAGFRGGKGVATACGVLFGLTPLSMTLTLIGFGLTLKATRWVAVSSIVACLLFPTTIAFRIFVLGHPLDASLFYFSLLIAALIIYAHKGNIARLRVGTEPKIKSFKPSGGMRASGQLTDTPS